MDLGEATEAGGTQQEQVNQVVASMVSEIILCTKEVNKRTRAAAYDLLVQIGHAMHEAEPPGRVDDDFDDDAMGRCSSSLGCE